MHFLTFIRAWKQRRQEQSRLQAATERWEAYLMTLIIDRYRCSPEEAVQIRTRFHDWLTTAEFPIYQALQSGDTSLLADLPLDILDSCAHPEWAEAAEQRAAEELRLSNQKAGALASSLDAAGLTCPHCHKHCTDTRFVSQLPSERSYFVCRLCGRSFTPADLATDD